MKWFGNYFISTLTFAKTYFATFCFVLASLGAMSFTSDVNMGIVSNDKDKTKKDTVAVTSDKQQFKSLFDGKSYDATRPYLAQLNPQAISYVESFVKKQGAEMERMKVWGKPYFTLYDGILKQYNLPLEMKYLSVIESHLRPGLVSWMGAVGPWQLMRDEASRFKLRVTKRYDERTDFTKSTHAASKLMTELYTQFGDWLLVVGAYNCGAGRMRKAIKQSGSKDFWKLQQYLPLETRNHVKKFIAVNYIFEKDKASLAAPEPVLIPVTDPNMVSIEISGKYNAMVIAKHVNIDMVTFNKLNAGLDKTMAEGKAYKMQLPIENMDLFSTRKHAILQESLQLLLNSAK